MESWHPGNLAYAMVRHPKVVPHLLREIKASPVLSNAFGICFRVSWGNILLRTQTFKDDPKWATDFYTQIGFHIEERLESLGLKEKCVFIDANHSYKKVYADGKKAVRRFAELGQ